MKPKSKSSPAGESPRDENKNKNLGGLLRIRRRFRRAASPIPIAMTSRTVGKKQVKRWKQVSTLRRRRAICFCLFFLFLVRFHFARKKPKRGAMLCKRKNRVVSPKVAANSGAAAAGRRVSPSMAKPSAAAGRRPPGPTDPGQV